MLKFATAIREPHDLLRWKIRGMPRAQQVAAAFKERRKVQVTLRGYGKFAPDWSI
jgi:hypothetical protein